MERRIENRQPAHILVLFLIVQFSGLLLLAYTSSSQVFQIINQSAPPPQQIGTTIVFVVSIIIYMVVAALVMLVILRFYHGNALFKAIETYVLGLPVFIVASLVLSSAFPQTNAVLTEGISLLLAAGIVILRNVRPRTINFAVVCASIGLGIVIGLYGFLFAYLFMAVLAIYDYIAVFITKHMVALAKGLSEKNLAFLIGSYDTEIIPKGYLSGKERKEYMSQLQTSKNKDPMIQRLIAQGKLPATSAVALGAGDLAVPLMLSVGLYMYTLSMFAAIVASAGAGVGLVATMYLLKRYKVALPAIPPLFAFMNLALAVAIPIIRPGTYALSLFFFLVFALTIGILLLTLRRLEKKRLATVS